MKNVFKAWVTSLIGTAILIVTTYSVYTHKVSWQWEGLLGLGAGTILLLAPQTIEKWINKIVNSKTKNE